MTDETDELLRVAQRGLEIEADLRSPVVQHILDRAREAADQALGKLVEADPAKPEEVRNLQNEVKRHYDIATWIKDAVEEGRQAIEELRARQEQD